MYRRAIDELHSVIGSSLSLDQPFGIRFQSSSEMKLRTLSDSHWKHCFSDNKSVLSAVEVSTTMRYINRFTYSLTYLETERQTCVHTPLISLVLRESRTFKSMSLMWSADVMLVKTTETMKRFDWTKLTRVSHVCKTHHDIITCLCLLLLSACHVEKSEEGEFVLHFSHLNSNADFFQNRLKTYLFSRSFPN